jgi:DNA-binding SARP family transcriptional activator/uncharacterized protein HemY
MPVQRSGANASGRPVFRVLGPIEVAGGAGPVQLAHREQTVLAMLLLEANRIVPVERLVDAVWEESPPATAKSQIQICVSAIRRALTAAGLPSVISTRSPGYLLHATEQDLDLHLFDRLSGDARQAAANDQLSGAAELYRDALSLRYGQPLAGLDSRLILAATVNVTERLLTTLEECIQLELKLGRHHDLVGELLGLVASHPLRERLHAHLMIALYRSGRQAEALAVYRDARRILAHEHGLEPGEELQRLERAILTSSAEVDLPDLDTPPETVPTEQVVPQLLPADIAVFAGRERLIRQLHGIVSAAGHDDDPQALRIIAIAGRGGVGKTALAVRLAHVVRADFPDGQLFVHLHGTEARPASPNQILERFLRALGVASSAIPEGLEERAELYRDRLAGRRILVVLDDVETEHQVAPLLPGTGGCAVIMTSRLRQTSLHSVHQVDLDVLDEANAIDMLVAVIGRPRYEAEPDAARELVDLCGRLPLAIRIAAARLAARPHWPIEKLSLRMTDSMRRLDELTHRGLAVRPSIAVSHEILSPKAKRLFRRLSILETPDFATWVAGPLLDDHLTTAEELLETLVDVRLLDAEQVAGRTRFHFHDLIRVYAREQLAAEQEPEQRREALRRTISAWLSLAAEAHRRLYGGDYTLLHGNAPLWTLPASLVDRLLAQPMEWLEGERFALVTAVRQAAEAGFDELCWDLAMTIVTLFEAHSHFDDWRETHDIALAVCQQAGNRRGEGAIRYSLGSLEVVSHRFEKAAPHLDAALSIFDELGDAHGQALALRNLAYLDRIRGALDSALAKYDQALTRLRAVGDLVGEAHALGGIAQIRLDSGDRDTAQRLLERALEITRAAGSHRVEAQILFRLGETLGECDELLGAQEAFESALRLVRDNGDTVGETYALYGLGRLRIRQQRYDEAASNLRAALKLADQSGGRLLTARVHFALGELYRDHAQPQRAGEHLQTALESFRRLDAQGWRARALIQLGHLYRKDGRSEAADAALAEADQLLASTRTEDG